MEQLGPQVRDISECHSIWDVLAEALKNMTSEVNAEISAAYAEGLKNGGYLDL